MKKRSLIVSVLLLLFAAVGCTPPLAKTDKLTVATSAYALRYFIEQVGGDEVDVAFSFTGSPHHITLTQQDAAAIIESDAFFNVEAGDYIELGAQIMNVHQDMPYFDVSKDIDLLPGEADHAGHDGHDHAHNDASPKRTLDPHIWLDPVRASTIVQNIATNLVSLKPEKAAYFTDNAAKIRQKLAALDTMFQQRLAGRTKDYILVNHPAYGYMANRYGFKQKAIHDISDHSENTQTSIIELDAFITAEDIHYLFIEPNAERSNLVDMLANKHKLEQVTLFNIETPVTSSADYFALMEENLANIQKAIG